MTRYSDSRRAETKVRILDEAARAFRELGLDGIGIQALMKRLGLTHGGFYLHFASRDALAAEALRRAADVAGGRLFENLDEAAEPIEELARRYLSAEHRDSSAQGCPVAALGSEAPRHGPEVSEAMGEVVRRLVAGIERLITQRARDSADRRRALALAIAAQLVGGLVLSRALGRGSWSNAVLAASRQFVGAMAKRPRG